MVKEPLIMHLQILASNKDKSSEISDTIETRGHQRTIPTNRREQSRNTLWKP